MCWLHSKRLKPNGRWLTMCRLCNALCTALTNSACCHQMWHRNSGFRIHSHNRMKSIQGWVEQVAQKGMQQPDSGFPAWLHRCFVTMTQFHIKAGQRTLMTHSKEAMAAASMHTYALAGCRWCCTLLLSNRRYALQ